MHLHLSNDPMTDRNGTGQHMAVGGEQAWMVEGFKRDSSLLLVSPSPLPGLVLISPLNF